MQIDLLAPVNDATTAPLQAYSLGDAAAAPLADPAAPIPWDDLHARFTDQSTPAPVHFAWRADPAGPVVYDLLISRRADLADARVLTDLPTASAEVRHLFVATRYYWKVVGRRAGQVVAESSVERFRTHSAPPRWIAADGITNVRDIGGWPLPAGKHIRQGAVYRGSEMNNHLELTPAGRHVLQAELGIRTDLDLRGENEQAGAVLDAEKVRWFNVPVQPYGHISEPAAMAAYRRVMAVFANEANYPILCHCWGGADRTGTVSLLLEALLGADAEQLACDYELTSLSVWGPRTRRSQEYQELLAALGEFGRAGDSINAHVEKYLLAIGVTAGEIGAIRRQLIVPDGADGWQGETRCSV